MTKPWERQAGETVKAYQAFDVYLRMENRSLEAVSRQLSKSVPLIKRWSAKYNWVDRVSAYEDYLAKLRIQQYEKKRLEARQGRQNLIDAMNGLIAKVYRYSDSMTDSQNRLNLDPSMLNALVSSATRMLEQSRKEYNDLPTNKHQLDVNIQQEIIALIQSGEVDLNMVTEVVGDKDYAVELFQQAGIDAY